MVTLTSPINFDYYGGEPVAAALTGLSNGEAVEGQHATTGLTLPNGVSALLYFWGNGSRLSTLYGTAAIPEDFTGGGTLGSYAHGDDGNLYFGSAPIDDGVPPFQIATLGGLRSGLAVPSARDGIYPIDVGGALDSYTYGVGAYGDATYGAGSGANPTPLDFSAHIGQSLLFEGFRNGIRYRAHAEIAAEPGALGVGDWTIIDAGTGAAATVTITALPVDNNAAFTEIQVRVDGVWSTLTSTPQATSYPLTAGLSDGVQSSVALRFVNLAGEGAISDVKPVTPSSGVAAPTVVGSIADQVFQRGVALSSPLDTTGAFANASSYALGPSSDPLPAGMTFVAGVFDGTPTEAPPQGERFEMTVIGINAGGSSSEVTFLIDVTQAGLSLVSVATDQITAQTTDAAGTLYWGIADTALSETQLLAASGGDLHGNFPITGASSSAAVDLSPYTDQTKTVTMLQVGTGGAWSPLVVVTDTITASSASSPAFGGWGAVVKTLDSVPTQSLDCSAGAPPGTAVGDMLFALCSSDGGSAHTASVGWEIVPGMTDAQGTQVRGSVFFRIADGGPNDAFTLGIAASQEAAVLIGRASGVTNISGVIGDNLAFNPAAHNPGVTAPIWVAGVASDSFDVVTGGPAGWTDFTTGGGGVGSSAQISAAVLVSAAASQDPPAFSGGGGEQNVAFNFAVWSS